MFKSSQEIRLNTSEAAAAGRYTNNSSSREDFCIFGKYQKTPDADGKLLLFDLFIFIACTSERRHDDVAFIFSKTIYYFKRKHFLAKQKLVTIRIPKRELLYQTSMERKGSTRQLFHIISALIGHLKTIYKILIGLKE